MKTFSDDAGRLVVARRVASLLEGFAITRVQYLTPASIINSPRIRGRGFEHAEAGIRLLDSNGRERTIRWAQHGFNEGLWIGEAPTPEEGVLWSPEARTVEVESWSQGAAGTVIEAVNIGWQNIGPDRFSIWSVRLILSHESIVVCLGERSFESGRPTYAPDCVLVVFSDRVAKDYHPIASPYSAWGPER